MGRRVTMIVLGALLALVAGSVAVGGAALMAVFGTDSTASSGTHRIASQHTALIARFDDIQDTNGFATVVGQPTLRLQAHGASGAVFVGVGPADAVERYLAGAPIDRVTDLEVDPFHLTTRYRPGTALPTAPAEQNFWTASDTGTDPHIDWKIADGSYRLVIMNADGSSNVAVDATAALDVPHLFGIGLALLIGGGLLAVGGVVLIVFGARPRTPRTPVTA